MTIRGHVAVLGLSALVALPLFAYRREYAVTWKGQRKTGSEVCFYRGTSGDAFSLFFTSTKVRCLSADAILDFPPGLIHAFARHKDGYASPFRDYTVYDGPPNPERGYEKLEIPLTKAGLVDFAPALKPLRANQHLGVWTSSTFIPLVESETTVLAPAEVPVVPLIIEDGVPVAVGEPLYLEPGERATTIFAADPDTSSVIVWTRLDGEPANDAPAITLKVNGHTIRPVAPLDAAESNTLLIFRGVPRGEATISVAGSSWKPVSRNLLVGERAVIVEREAIPLVAGGSVVAQWSSGSERPPISECGAAHAADLPLVRASLLRCTNGSCSTIAKTTAPYDTASSIRFDGVPAGPFTLTLEPPYGKRQSLEAQVVVGQRTTLSVNFPSFGFFGTVKLNGKPVQARLIFASGQAVSDADGRYTATLAADPRGDQIQIEPCGEKRTLTFIARTAPELNSVYDIDLRIGTLDVQVNDPQHRVVPGASVHFTPMKQTGEVYFGSSPKQTDANGRVTFDDVPEDFLVGVCAKQKQFLPKCSRFDLTKLRDHPATLEFDPAGMRGHVEGHSGQGYVSIVSPSGIETEQAHLDADGTFLLRSSHQAPEYLIYVSDARPLTVMPLPLVAPPDLAIKLYNAPVRSFTVSAPGMKAEDGFVGVWIGNMYVPIQILNMHMELRGLDSMLHRGQSLQLRDIAETAPISVALGVPDPAARDFVDVFTLPQYAGVVRQRVQGAKLLLQ